MKLVWLIQSFVDIGILGQVAMGTTLTSTKRESCKQLALKHIERFPERFVVLIKICKDFKWKRRALRKYLGGIEPHKTCLV